MKDEDKTVPKRMRYPSGTERCYRGGDMVPSEVDLFTLMTNPKHQRRALWVEGCRRDLEDLQEWNGVVEEGEET